uniref:Reverse transcriptase domain-containing protein n=1 Tax=Photinus pyralis TaxID=7054 RepID=A0A1Y1NNC4_PHOPY
MFTKIDLSQAYAQLELDEESKRLVAINTHRGLFVYNRLPYGISSAPGIFQQMIEQTLAGIKGVAIFLDDILITGRNKLEHLNTLRIVFEKLKHCGLKLRKDKCDFFRSEITYLGHTINKDGLNTSPDKIEAILNAKMPSNVTELKAFLGLINYYGKFIPNLSSKLHALYFLLKKDVVWNWNDTCQDVFNSVKNELTSHKILVHYNPKLPVTLACDASAYGLGAVISHRYLSKW